jgi:hypothetical protein
MKRKRLKHRPTRAEIGDVPLRPWKRDYKHYHDGGPGGDAEIAVHVGKNNPGRPKGALNRTTRAVKEAILSAAEFSRHSKDHSVTGYLEFLANEYPVAFSKLLSRLVPYDLRFRADVRVETREEIQAQLAARGIHIDRIFPVPQVPRPGAPVLERRPDPAPRDEDRLDREQPQPAADDVSEPPRRTENIYSPNYKPPPAPPIGPMPVGTQMELPFGGYSSNFDLCCWHWGRPPRLVSDRSNDEETTNETPQESRQLQRR